MKSETKAKKFSFHHSIFWAAFFGCLSAIGLIFLRPINTDGANLACLVAAAFVILLFLDSIVQEKAFLLHVWFAYFLPVALLSSYIGINDPNAKVLLWAFGGVSGGFMFLRSGLRLQ